MYAAEVSNFSLWWLFPLVMIVLCFLMMRGRKGSMMCGFGSSDEDSHRINVSDSAKLLLEFFIFLKRKIFLNHLAKSSHFYRYTNLGNRACNDNHDNCEILQYMCKLPYYVSRDVHQPFQIFLFAFDLPHIFKI